MTKKNPKQSSLPTWIEALISVPRLNQKEWNELGIITRWLIATRAGVLIMTLTSAFIAILWSIRVNSFHFYESALVCVGLTLAHATNNLLNDLVDWKKGVDHQNYFRNKYGTHPMSVMSENEFLVYMTVTGSLALLIGLLLCAVKGMEVVYLFLFGSFFLLFYTWPLKYYGLGEIAVFIVWGFLMISGGFYTITSKWDDDLFLVSLPYSLSVTSVLFGKHIDKLYLDRKKKIYTLPVILGHPLARIVTILIFTLQFALSAYLYYRNIVGGVIAVVLLALPDYYYAVRVYSKQAPSSPPAILPPGIWPLWYVAFAFNLTRKFGLYYLFALVVDTYLRFYPNTFTTESNIS